MVHRCRELCNRHSAYTGVVSRSTAKAALPSELALPLSFVNTLDVEEARDEFGSAEGLRSWLEDRGLVGSDARVSRRELALAIELRDVLRRTFLAHSGFPLAIEELEAVNRVL